ncbi:hypothetical protein OPT61_g8621 [Boeremia exigua]|uniref:Uncharacterized protein n=1 Tax=Boeremia exigua TaxID=749465 RepID=A0ACC2HYD3_9PLEO|nr:hypothetical protein OPT61_g8621 [Boeremia exigua]
MVATTSFFTACSIFALSLAAPISKHVATRSVVPRGAYVMFGGDGTRAAGWPSQKSWLSFDDAWEANLETVQNSCEVEGWGVNNSDAEMQALKDSIIGESKASGIPKVREAWIMKRSSL